MFQEWGFLISEMLLLIILAALLGLLVGWIIWGRRSSAAAGLSAELEACRKGAKTCEADLTACRGDLKSAKAELETCRAEAAEKDKQIATLEKDVEKAEALAEAAEVAAMEAAGEAVAVAEAVEADHGAHPVHPAPEPEAAQSTEQSTAAASEAKDAGKDYDGDGVIEGENEGTKPTTLAAARDGGPDDLKQIKGVGPKLEQLCNELGFFHFDQVAAWSADEVAWVDANLKGFKGRVSRDNWVEQAKVLAAGGTTAFSKKVKKGGVYD